MAEIIRGFHYDIGGREVYEDRVDIQEFTTPGNLSLLVAVVADGVGGENKGERASQLAIDTLFQYMKSSPDTVVPALLTKACQVANHAVHTILEETGGASTTLSVAAVHEGKTLYIANIGDSRIYLCRNQTLTQLTIDHTYGNIMPWQGKISPEEAQANPRAEALMRALGPRAQIPVDIGFYVNTTDPSVAHGRGKGGLALRNGDSILVCSDGLTKISHRTGQPFTTPEEIVRVLNTQEGEKASRSLVSFALGRNADDNVSAAVLQMPDPARKRRARRPMFIIGGVVITLFIIAAIIVWSLLRDQGQQQTTISTTATAAAMIAEQAATSAAGAIATSEGEISELAEIATATMAAAATRTAVVAAFTPTSIPTETPTPTPRPTRIANQIGILIAGSNSSAFTLADSISSGDEPAELYINHNEAEIKEDARIFTQPSSRIEFENITNDPGAEAGISILLFEGSEIFVSTGGYVKGIDISPIGDSRVSFLATNACFSMKYDEDTEVISLGCYGGECRYRGDERDDLQQIPARNVIQYSVQEREVVETRSIRLADSNIYKAMLLRTDAGREVYNRCILPLFPPTRTPTPTDIPVCLTPLPTGCQAKLQEAPTAASLGITAVWLGIGLLFGVVTVLEKPIRRKL